MARQAVSCGSPRTLGGHGADAADGTLGERASQPYCRGLVSRFNKRVSGRRMASSYVRAELLYEAHSPFDG